MLRTFAMIALAVAAAGPTSASSPLAEVLCAPTAQMEQRLSEQMRSKKRATGLRGPDQVVEVWIDGRDNWTLVARYASGTSCILAMGAHWSPDLTSDPA